ncbi:MAG: putative zinc-binding peptidase [Chitinophagales bacterium]
MKIFQCSNCNHPVFFENTLCESCGHWLGYLDGEFEMYALNPNQKNSWQLFADKPDLYQYCGNFAYNACNWLIPLNHRHELCTACQINRVIPNSQDADDLDKWQRLERAKHRLVYSLQRFELPIQNKVDNPENGLAFDFLSNKNRAEDEPNVLTGHANGVITLNIEEADSAYREYMRKKMDEPYRTLIGHFRHEIGHYYWDVLVRPNLEILTEYREKFGDERIDYGEALEKYYKEGPSPSWQHSYISEYATAHSWEDWAETWAHYLHLIDTLETAYAFGLSLHPNLQKVSTMNMQAGFNPYYQTDFDRIIEACASLTFAINSLNRSMGQPDLYPFIFNPSIVEKLRFVHHLLINYRAL